MKLHCRIIFALFFLFAFNLCTVQRPHIANLSFLYDSDLPGYLYSFSLFHKENSTELLLRTPSLSFFQHTGGDSGKNTSKIFLHYKFYNDFRGKIPVDSGTFILEDTAYSESHLWHDYSIEIPYKGHQQGELRVFVGSQGQVKSYTFPLFYNRKDFAGSQYFYSEHKDYGRIPKTVINTGDTFCLHISPLIKANVLYAAYFSHFSEAAMPPYSADWNKAFDWKPEKIFRIICDSGKTPYMCFNQPGLYHLMVDTLRHHGFTIFVPRPDFPFITSHELMTGPIRYISSIKEFRKIENSIDAHKAVEEFWLSICSGSDAAKKQIKEYYNRVQLANMYFTSYKEGWMTDRGMIYIVMGIPNIVYKSVFSELWIYGQDKSVHSVSFEFRKQMNPLSDNDFVLKRNPTYKDKWYMANDMWRR